MSNLPVLDRPSALSRLMNNEALYNQLIQMFISQVNNLPPLQIDVNDNQADLLLAIHSLKGSAGEIGARALHAVLSDVEHTMKHGPEKLTDADFQHINEELTRVMEVIKPNH